METASTNSPTFGWSFHIFKAAAAGGKTEPSAVDHEWALSYWVLKIELSLRFFCLAMETLHIHIFCDKSHFYGHKNSQPPMMKSIFSNSRTLLPAFRFDNREFSIGFKQLKHATVNEKKKFRLLIESCQWI